MFASDCQRCTIKEWNSSKRNSESGKHLGKINLQTEFALFCILHSMFSSHVVQFSCLVLNKSVLAKTSLIKRQIFEQRTCD